MDILLKYFFAHCLLCVSFLQANQCETVFTDIWQNNYWGGDSRSGTGSDLIQTEVIRGALPALLKKYECKILVDAPCGDFYWMKYVDLPVEKYIGIDIVKPLVWQNQASFGNSICSFIFSDITNQIPPKGDLILCRDCLGHFSYADIAKAIRTFKKSGSTYLLTTCFTESEHYMMNVEISTGEWRPLDLRLAPFYFPEPLEIINENCTVIDNAWNDKSLFLWRIEDLPDLEIK
ncbi:MAG TPA: class I SAM-dependent methyltransferase [Chlamydiales bacterium]|nr:class I SAM-dependent methyltransferase [Chlamydiales bacterium]